MDRCQGRLLTTLDRANARRREMSLERGELFAGITNRTISLGDAMDHPSMRRMRAFSFLTRLPSIGEVRARRILDEVRVADGQRLSMIGSCQRERMIALATEAMAKRGACSR